MIKALLPFNQSIIFSFWSKGHSIITTGLLTEGARNGCRVSFTRLWSTWRFYRGAAGIPTPPKNPAFVCVACTRCDYDVLAGGCRNRRRIIETIYETDVVCIQQSPVLGAPVVTEPEFGQSFCASSPWESVC